MITSHSISTLTRSMRELSIAQLVGLHLGPGLLITLGYVVLAPIIAQQGLPPVLAQFLAFGLLGIPCELGYLMYQGWKRNKRLSLEDIVLYREAIPFSNYLILVPLLLLWLALTSVLLIPLGDLLRNSFFAWLPGWFFMTNFVQNLGNYSHPVLLITVVFSLCFNIVGPFVEEYYFRGYLLPRMTYFQGWAPLLNVVLFSLYHFWLPWENLSRIAGLLPLVYAVWWKRNIYLSIWVHCLVNILGSIGLLVLVLNQP